MSTLTDFTIDGKSFAGDVFVESGFYRGASFRNALAAGFAELHSIDLVRDYVDAAWMMFGKEFGRVHFYQGTSPDVLRALNFNPIKRTTFFLDAHYQSDGERERDLRYGECPVLQEIAEILKTRWIELPVILVDDHHMFAAPRGDGYVSGFDPGQWPRLEEIVEALPDHDLVVREDILYFLPKRWKGWSDESQGKDRGETA